MKDEGKKKNNKLHFGNSATMNAATGITVVQEWVLLRWPTNGAHVNDKMSIRLLVLL